MKHEERVRQAHTPDGIEASDGCRRAHYRRSHWVFDHSSRVGEAGGLVRNCAPVPADDVIGTSLSVMPGLVPGIFADAHGAWCQGVNGQDEPAMTEQELYFNDLRNDLLLFG
jgi:hypothetical protein